MENKFSNKEIAYLLRCISAAYELKNENIFKIIAYDRASEVVEHLSEEIKDIWQKRKLTEIPGIGPSIAGHLDEYFSNGVSKHFGRVLNSVPSTVFILMKIPSIGPKKAYKLTKSLRLFNDETVIEDLKNAALKNKIAEIEGFGEKSQTEILEAIIRFQQNKQIKERMPLPFAYEKAKQIINYLKENPLILRIDVLGSLRRMVSTIGDIDIAVVADDKNAKKIIDYFIRYPDTQKIDNAGEKKASIIISSDVRVDLRVQSRVSYGSMLQYFTGSKTHNIKLREYGLKKGYSLSEYGITNLNKKELYKFEDEADFYKFLGLEYIPPELREGTNEIEKAKNHSLPRLVELSDIKGDLHIHTNYDIKSSHDFGADSPLEIAVKAKQLGYEYVGFSDHNPNRTHNNEQQVNAILKRRKAYIDKVLSINKIEHSKYFIGIEADILPDGTIALPKESVKYLDYIIIGIHSSFRMSIKEMTARIIRALEFPKVKIISHPTGRLINKREGIQADWDKIFTLCKDKNIALEINAWPIRLDFPDTLVRSATEAGVKLCVNTDAHALDETELMFYGIEVAKRGWAGKNDIINTLSLDKFTNWLKEGEI